MPDGLPFKLEGYLELVDWSGRILRERKRGAIMQHYPAILLRLGLPTGVWERLNRQFRSKSSLCFGSTTVARQMKDHFGLKRLRLAG